MNDDFDRSFLSQAKIAYDSSPELYTLKIKLERAVEEQQRLLHANHRLHTYINDLCDRNVLLTAENGRLTQYRNWFWAIVATLSCTGLGFIAKLMIGYRY